MADDTITVSIRMPREMRQALQHAADADERSLSWFALRILREWVERNGQDKPARGKGKR